MFANAEGVAFIFIQPARHEEAGVFQKGQGTAEGSFEGVNINPERFRSKEDVVVARYRVAAVRAERAFKFLGAFFGYEVHDTRHGFAVFGIEGAGDYRHFLDGVLSNTRRKPVGVKRVAYGDAIYQIRNFIAAAAADVDFTAGAPVYAGLCREDAKKALDGQCVNFFSDDCFLRCCKVFLDERPLRLNYNFLSFQHLLPHVDIVPGGLAGRDPDVRDALRAVAHIRK